MKKLLPAIIALCACIMPTQNAHATLLTFRLFNHPDGGAWPPLYGLRLDELYDQTGNHDIFTFSFEAPGTGLFLDFDTSLNTVRIHGRAFGGLDAGNTGGYVAGHSGFVDIDFTYQNNVTAVGSNGSVFINPDDPNNNGGITLLAGGFFMAPGGLVGSTIGLVDEDGGHGFSFKFNNFDDHRLSGHGLSGPETFVGWGWVNHGGNPHVAASDWLFTARPIPEPSTLILLGIGMLVLCLSTLRRKGASSST